MNLNINKTQLEPKAAEGRADSSAPWVRFPTNPLEYLASVLVKEPEFSPVYDETGKLVRLERQCPEDFENRFKERIIQ